MYSTTRTVQHVKYGTYGTARTVRHVQYSSTSYRVAAKVDHAIVIVANIIPRGPFKLTRMERPARPITGRRQYPREIERKLRELYREKGRKKM